MQDEKEMRQRLEERSNAELISILLKRDGKEWPPEAIELAGSILSERGSAEGTPLQCVVGSKSVLEEIEGLNLKIAAEYVSRLDAEHDQLVLRNEGVQAWIFETEGNPSKGLPSSVQLKVLAEDWSDAMERLASEDMRHSEQFGE